MHLETSSSPDKIGTAPSNYPVGVLGQLGRDASPQRVESATVTFSDGEAPSAGAGPVALNVPMAEDVEISDNLGCLFGFEHAFVELDDAVRTMRPFTIGPRATQLDDTLAGEVTVQRPSEELEKVHPVWMLIVICVRQRHAKRAAIVVHVAVGSSRNAAVKLAHREYSFGSVPGERHLDVEAVEDRLTLRNREIATHKYALAFLHNLKIRKDFGDVRYKSSQLPGIRLVPWPTHRNAMASKREDY